MLALAGLSSPKVLLVHHPGTLFFLNIMSKTFYSYFLSGLFLLTCQAAVAQVGVSDRINKETDRAPSKAAMLEAAEKAYAAGDFNTAMQYSYRIVQADSLNMAALDGFGKAAVALSAFERADTAYQRMVENKMVGLDGLALLHWADVKFRLERFSEANVLYARFLNGEMPANTPQSIIEQARESQKNAEWAADILLNDHSEIPFTLLPDVNTVEYSEFSPVMFHDTLYYSSYSFPFEKDKRFPKRHLIKVMTGTLQADTLATQAANFNEENLHTAHVAFNRAEDVMYYTVCEFVETAIIRCDLYQRRRMPNGTWGAAMKLPETVNAAEYTTTEPSVGHAPNSDQEVLYFVSDRPGGKGKRDLWASQITPEGFATPVNLTALNTKEDDVTPFYHSKSATLYFSTMGRRTLGGFDIYRTKGVGNQWTEPQHIGLPFNSSANDVYYTLGDGERSAFMASNRRGSFNESEEACCYDLYKADLIKPEMLAVTFHKVTKDSLYGTEIRLLEMTASGPGQEVKVNVPGAFTPFALSPGKDYMLIATKDGYEPDTVRFSTPKSIWRDVMVQKLYLAPAKVNLVVTVFDKDTNLPMLGATVRFTDLGSPGTATGSVVPRTDVHPNDNRYDYDLQFNHDYKVVASKAGYTIDSTTVTTVGLAATQTLTRQLYLRRGIDFKALSYDFVSKEPLNAVTFRLVEITSGREKIVGELTSSTSSNQYQTIIDFKKRYLITASKEGYSRDSLEFNTEEKNIEEVEFQTIVKKLYLRPLILDRYLPIKLYFDNDEPDKRTLATATKQEYRATYVTYIRRKQDFIQTYTEGMAGNELQQETDSMDVFFERDIRGGWNKLMSFSEILYELLERGDKIEITLKGYASPRAGSAYNLNLTARRVSSVLNHFLIFDGGIYNKYVKSGQLIIKQEPNGEAKSPPGVVDNIDDIRRSWYSVPASRERRLEIIGVQINVQRELGDGSKN